MRNLETATAHIQELFTQLLNDVDGYKSAWQARAKFTGNTSKLTYGEVTANSVIDILTYLNTQDVLDTPKRVLDIGSGIGKFMLGMSISELFSAVDGIELLPDLNADAIALATQSQQQFATYSFSPLHFHCGNAFDYDLSNYDILFSNSPVDENYYTKMITKISAEAKPGALVITTITPFTSEVLQRVHELPSTFSWKESTLYFSEVRRD